MKKIAVITGASSGIGRSISLQLAKEFKLYLCGRNIKELKRTVDLINGPNEDCSVIQMDLSDKESIQQAAKDILNRENQIDLLVNNAGLSQRSLANQTDETVESRLFQVNYFGPVLLTKLLLPALRNAGSSKIAVTSSIVGKFGYPLRATYSAAKHALHGFFESLGLEEKKYGISIQLWVIGRAQTQVSMNALTSDGAVYGKMDNGQAQGISPDDCARRLVKALKTNKREVKIGGKEIWMVNFKKYLPFLFYYIAQKEANHV